jgi:hypothetical protein
MSYIIFKKNSENLDGVVYKIAENESDLNNLNFIKSEYEIIEISEEDFNNIKYHKKTNAKYNNQTVFLDNFELIFKEKKHLSNYVNNFKNIIKLFLDNNSSHILFNKWNNYYNQLDNLNLDNITYPLNKSLEQYFNDLGQTSLNPLQLP